MPGLLSAGLVVGVGYLLYSLFKGNDESEQGSQGTTPTSGGWPAPSTQAPHRYYARHDLEAGTRIDVDHNIDQQTHQVCKRQAQVPQTSTNDRRLFDQYHQQPRQYGGTESSVSIPRPPVNDGIYAPERALPCGCRGSIPATNPSQGYSPYDYEDDISASTYLTAVWPALQSAKPAASVARQQKPKPKPNDYADLQNPSVKQRLPRVDVKASGVTADVHFEASITIELDSEAEDSDILAAAKRLRRDAQAAQREQKAYAEGSKKAKERGSKSVAKNLAARSAALETRAEHLNRKAADLFFRVHNKNCGSNCVDLHNQGVEEAKRFAASSIRKARNEGHTSIVFIVGKGLHAKHGEAKLKPALLKWLNEQDLVATVDKRNTGRLVVTLNAMDDDDNWSSWSGLKGF